MSELAILPSNNELRGDSVGKDFFTTGADGTEKAAEPSRDEGRGLMQRYEAYKPSTFDWLGDIPEHWSLLRAKYVFQEIDDRSISGEEELLSVSHLTGVTPRSEKNVTMFLAEDYTGAKLCRDGDLVINTMWAWMGALGVSQSTGIISPAYGVYRQHNDQLRPRFADWLFRTPTYVAEYTRQSTGVNSSRLRLYPDRFLGIPVLIPPKKDQDRIVNFLNQKTSEIDAAIVKKERLIDLLFEQQSILVSQAVTCGLNASAPLQDCEIEGISKFPAHWSIVANRRIFREKSKKYYGQDLPPLSLSQKDGLIQTDDMKERSLKTSSFEHFRVCLVGDLVLNRFKAHLGVFFAAKLSGVITFHYGIYTPEPGVCSKYFELLFHTNAYCAIFAGASNGMTVGLQNLSNQNFYDVKSILPPYREQTEIVSYVGNLERRYSTLIHSIKKELGSLQEMKKLLISEAITGHLKVPSAQGRE
jgi:type I restriction enzyme, S subunit